MASLIRSGLCCASKVAPVEMTMRPRFGDMTELFLQMIKERADGAEIHEFLDRADAPHAEKLHLLLSHFREGVELFNLSDFITAAESPDLSIEILTELLKRYDDRVRFVADLPKILLLIKCLDRGALVEQAVTTIMELISQRSLKGLTLRVSHVALSVLSKENCTVLFKYNKNPCLLKKREGRISACYRPVKHIAETSTTAVFLMRNKITEERVVYKHALDSIFQMRTIEDLVREFSIVREIRGDIAAAHPEGYEIEGIQEPCHEVVEFVFEGGRLQHRRAAGLLMRYYEEGDLCDRRPASDGAEAMEVVRQLSKGMSDAHGVGWTHGDLKGDNVLCSGDDKFCVADWSGTKKIELKREAFTQAVTQYVRTGTVNACDFLGIITEDFIHSADMALITKLVTQPYEEGERLDIFTVLEFKRDVYAFGRLILDHFENSITTEELEVAVLAEEETEETLGVKMCGAWGFTEERAEVLLRTQLPNYAERPTMTEIYNLFK
jgi:hypothetical protein